MLGTSALERSLNLQNANILVNVDMLMNPSRMRQLAGRVRRAGSKHSHIFIFNLLTTNSQEERYEKVLASRAAMSDYIFNETSEMFAKLTPMELLSLISP
jgi:SNF2 family DNA or RNA helicase